MAGNERDRTLALAGVFQAARLVQEVATQGRCDEAALETCINSVFNTSPASAEAVYGSALCLTPGLRTLLQEFGHQAKQRRLDITRYVLALIYLERKLSKQPDLLDRIKNGIERSRGQLSHFPPTHSNVMASLADVYAGTVSTLNPRIMVHGDPNYLGNPDTANKIRALLLAGIRAAVLWRQCGGGRWTLLFSRTRLVEQASRILASVHG